MGKSDGGKSTLVVLLMRSYDSVSGAVKLSEVDVHHRNVRHLRENVVGIVFQDPFLVSGTLAESSAFGTVGATHAEIEAAAAGVADFARRLLDPFDTSIARLSEREKQRVMVSRYLVKQPTSVVLDDANAS